MTNIDIVIASGEFLTGVVYIAISWMFVAKAAKADDSFLTIFNTVVSSILMVNGIEEIVDSLVFEGDGIKAWVLHGLLTSIQFLTGVVVLVTLFKARIWRWH